MMARLLFQALATESREIAITPDIGLNFIVAKDRSDEEVAKGLW